MAAITIGDWNRFAIAIPKDPATSATTLAREIDMSFLSGLKRSFLIRRRLVRGSIMVNKTTFKMLDQNSDINIYVRWSAMEDGAETPFAENVKLTGISAESGRCEDCCVTKSGTLLPVVVNTQNTISMPSFLFSEKVRWINTTIDVRNWVSRKLLNEGIDVSDAIIGPPLLRSGTRVSGKERVIKNEAIRQPNPAYIETQLPAVYVRASNTG